MVTARTWAVYRKEVLDTLRDGRSIFAMFIFPFLLYPAMLFFITWLQSKSDEEAKSLLIDRGFQSEGEALGKIQRAKLSSTQLSTYFVGRMAFYRLRQSVQRAMGEKFNLARYHEAVLGHGILPVKYLPELMK